ncbi:MAG: NAD(P)/FAD-dependent oxidoreductase [Spirochaetales bacterium]|nr:NAD(P)/FAD-dependent oxidoreductase [Spirochaetales bacterium]
MSKRAIVLGGGIGGVVAARALRRSLDRVDEVVLIDKNPDHLFAPSLLWVMIGNRRPDQIRRPLSGLERYGIRFVQGEVTEVDPVARRVELAGRSFEADYLLLSPGLRTQSGSFGQLPHAHNLYTMEGAEALGRALAKGSAPGEGTVLVTTTESFYRCPAAPYEAALLIRDRLRDRPSVRVVFHAAESTPMGVAGPHVSAAVKSMLAARGVEYRPDSPLTVEGDVICDRQGAAVEAGLVAFVPEHRPAEFLVKSKLLGEHGGISVDRQMRTNWPGVFAVGDATAIRLSNGKLLPRAGVFAHAQAEVASAAIAADAAGRSAQRRFQGHGQCFLEIGGGRAAFARGNFLAEPEPDVRLYSPSFFGRFAKFLFEQHWLRTRL